METEKQIGFELRTLSNLIKREVDNAIQANNLERLTGMQGFVIGYLYRNQGRDVFQRDLETEFSIRRSTVTTMLQLMEKNGLITREPVARDGRLKRLVLTDKAVKRHELVRREIHGIDVRMAQGLSEAELRAFLTTIKKIKANLGE